MDIRLADIIEYLEGILSCTSSREEASAWAYAAIRAHDRDELIFTPAEDRDAIWDGLGCLILVDAAEPNQTYLYAQADITDWLHKLQTVPYAPF